MADKYGRPISTTYRVYDRKTGELVVEGTSKECSEAVGAPHRDTIRSAYKGTRNGTYKGYRIEEVRDGEARSDAEAIRNWEAFMRPLRKKYGIPVKRMFVEDKKNGK